MTARPVPGRDERIERLAALRRQFSSAAARERVALLSAPLSRPSPALLRALHDECLFAVAYADGERVRATAERALLGIASEVERRAGRGLTGSGIAGSLCAATYSLDLCEWLCSRFAHRVNLDWNDPEFAGALEDLLPELLPIAERDGWLSNEVSAQEWLALGGADPLTAILRLFRRAAAAPALRDRLFESLGFPVRWQLGAAPSAPSERAINTGSGADATCAASRTFLRFPARRPFWQREPLLRDFDASAWLAKPLPRRAHCTSRDAQSLIDVARATLAVRLRETDPVTYANPREVELFSLERGIDVALLGMQPARRLPIESYFGFVAARNRVPIAYGGGWVFGRRCEIGVNLFEEFRGGESAFIFTQILRVYHRHYRAAQFLVDPFQFGAGNREAIRSGAFWFYYRLGFRPIDPRLRALADAEAARLAAAGARSSSALLRRLTGSKLFLDTDAPTPPASHSPRAPDLVRVSLALSRRLARLSPEDRAAAEARAVASVRKRLGVRDRGWTAEEKLWFARLAPLALLVAPGDLSSPARRASLAAALRMKGAARERDYALRLARLDWFMGALNGAAARD